MRSILQTLIAVCLLPACTVTGWAQLNIALVAEADTCIREHSPTAPRGTSSTIEVRSLVDGSTGRQNIGYMRFNLGVLTSAPQAGAVFSVARDAGGSFSNGVMHVYGLPDTFCNTPQGWVENGLTYNNSGSEVPGDGDSLTQDLDPGRLQYIGDLPPTTAVGDVLSVSNAALDAFLADRFADGGLATLIIVAENLSGTEGRFETISGATAERPAPTLHLVGTTNSLPPDTTAPIVSCASPLPGATGVALDTIVTATFSEDMDTGTITNGTPFFLLDGSSSMVSAGVVYGEGGLTLTLTPDAVLGAGVTYTATVLGGAGGVADDAGNPMAADYTWTFTTASETVPPTVVSVSPSNGVTGVEASTRVEATFDEAMDAATITSSSFFLEDSSGNPVAASVGYDGLTASLIPTELLGLTETYTATVKGGPGGVTDISDNPMAADYTWSFTVSRFASPVRLIPDADARLANDTNRGPTSSTGAGTDASTYECRWYDDGSAQRVRIAYIRFDVSDIPPALYPSATISGTFTDSARNGPGEWNVWGLNDDVVSDGAGRLGNDWPEGEVNYSNAAGVNNSTPLGSFEIIDSETTFLGTITLDGIDVQPLPFSSNREDLDLTAFLEADTDGLVTLLWVNSTVASSGGEYRIDSKEGNTADGHGPTTLNFEPATDIIDVELAAGPSMVLTWGVRSNYTYGVERTSEDLISPDWVGVASNLVGELVNTYTDSVPVEAGVSYRVVNEGEIPPDVYLFEDFETGGAGWTFASTGTAGTAWAIGEPIVYGGGLGLPPSGGYDSTHAAGTNLEADYGSSAAVSMYSPEIDLTSATAASVSFANYYDTEGAVDVGELYIRDDTGAEIAGLETPIASYDDVGTSWTIVSHEVPTNALGRTVKLEFYFHSDSAVEYAGWYVDDVRVGE